MTMPYYVAPEQVMKDRAEYAQKGIARGRALVAVAYADGILIVAENPSRTLHKVSEIYDRIAFAGVGKYNEFDQLRVAGIRHADTKGYAYSPGGRRRPLARQPLRPVPGPGVHPRDEAARGRDPRRRARRRPATTGSTTSPTTGPSSTRRTGPSSAARPRRSPPGSSRPSTTAWTLGTALQGCVACLAGPDRTLGVDDLEVGVLEKSAGRRAFRRIERAELSALLGA